MKLEKATKERYNKAYEHLYGFKEEEATMKIMRSNISSALSNYSGASKSLPKTKPAANPLAAVFAFKMQQEQAQKNQEENELKDKEIEQDMADGKLRSKSQMKLVMSIKRKVELEM